MITTHFMAFFASTGAAVAPPMVAGDGPIFVLKSPGSKLDWPISWPLEDGESIAASVWAVLPTHAGGLAVMDGSPITVGLVTSCLVEGGVNRRVYELVNTITTSAGRVHEATITFRIGRVPTGA
ncbi:hypothetical protein [Sandarakinorhabdus sp.]|uniref:phage fiber-tail adaptor protein n=1 Tax=Sandarakinorhabdus sp. TaxID=1916663 RepID=UPI00286D7420|nr:hypothetical protein [Sandarakinorhabdus sp.]